jgi:pimeloyl-ACP methyl ester carboxylesterase
MTVLKTFRFLEENMAHESLMLEVNGIRMHAVSAGQGPAVVLLHGFPDTHMVWRKQIGVLAAAGFRVIAPDLRGYGRTDAPAGVMAYTLEQLRADVIGLLDALKIDQADLVGHDWGGIIGWQLAALAPQRLRRFVALSVGHPSALAHAGVMQRLRMTYVLGFAIPGLAEHALRAADWFAMRQFTGEPGQADYWKQDLSPPGRLTAALNYYRANLSLALPHAYPHVNLPVMGIWSDRDPALGERQMRDSAHYVTGEFRFERIRDADHWLQLTAHEQVNRLLLAFLKA